jgi:type IV pilus assembly protein PilA
MLARLHRSMENRDEGFTLIELLVVMIIIGILAAIAIPVFLSQRAKAQDSAAKADVSTIGKEIATYYVDNILPPTLAPGTTTVLPGRYVLTPSGGVATDIGKISTNVVLGTKIFTSPTSWCVDVTNASGSTKTYKYSAKGGLASTACAATDAP